MSKPIYQVIERPLITEKSVRQAQKGRYTFRCQTSANKIEIRAAIEAAYECKVAGVNTLTVKGKAKRTGRARPGKAADWTKAIVTLADGDKATRLKEIFEGA